MAPALNTKEFRSVFAHLCIITHSRFQRRFSSFQDTQTLLCPFDEFVHLRFDDFPEIGLVFPDGVFGNEREVLAPQEIRYANSSSGSSLPFRGGLRAGSGEGRHTRRVRFV